LNKIPALFRVKTCVLLIGWQAAPGKVLAFRATAGTLAATIIEKPKPIISCFVFTV
jgi:hypothetical protein